MGIGDGGGDKKGGSSRFQDKIERYTRVSGSRAEMEQKQIKPAKVTKRPCINRSQIRSYIDSLYRL